MHIRTSGRTLIPRTATAIALFASVVFTARHGHAADGEVTARESIVRSAPAEVAPELARVRAGDRLSADDRAEDGWRRVRLADGRYGFLHDADARVAPPAAAATPARDETNALTGAAPNVADATVPSVGGAIPTSAPTALAEAQPPGPQSGPILFGVMFELLPVGTLKATSSSGSQSSNASLDAASAMAVAPFLDVPVSPYFALGLSPQIVFHVKGEGTTGESSTEIDLRARLTGRLPMSPRVRVYGRLSPAYSTVFLPAGPANATPVNNPAGLLIDLSVGTEIALLPNLYLVVDLGYQLGFQSTSSGDGTTVDGTRYPHLGGGLAIGL